MGVPRAVADESIWAKSRGLDPGLPPYPLVRHLADAAAMALHLWDVYLSDGQRRTIERGLGLAGEPERARSLVGLCAGLHDIGKVSGFQFCSRHGREHLGTSFASGRRGMEADRLGHDVAGMEAAAEVLEVLGFDVEGSWATERVAEIIGGHHGRFHRNEAWGDSPFLGGLAWSQQRIAHASAVHGVLGAPVPPSSFDAPAAVLVTGVVILADWLVSQTHYLRTRQRQLASSLEAHFARSVADAPGLLEGAGLVPVCLEHVGFGEAYGIEGGPNPLQRSIMEELPGAVAGGGGRGGVALITTAPGDGKTEGALTAEKVLAEAFGTRGLVFLLPTTATSDQMYGRVSKALVRQSGQGAGLTLVHSMAWLNSAYSDEELDPGSGVVTCDGDECAAGSSRAEADMRPRRWLRGPKRPLLAQFSVGTVDQALMAVLPVRHNALRLLGLSGKTVVVDEAHAYEPYMQVLLGRLLNWLGVYGVPVVLLSATLPVSVSERLLKEYLDGSGADCESREDLPSSAPYPGWLYVDGATGRRTPMSGRRRREQAAERNMELGLRVEPVGERGRLAVVERLVEPVARGEGGSALVVCNTVGDAQETYRRLRERFDDRSHEDGGIVHLLHARFPGNVREARTRGVTDGLGRVGPRPERRIVVATQVVEQSLDLDADLVVSDLAPLALLLQRAGRCWRHENWWARHGYPGDRGRPGWARAPRLVVLDPLVGTGTVPKRWGEVYSEYLLRLTSARLRSLDGGVVSIPDDVQELVESVHGTGVESFDWDAPGGEYQQSWAAHAGTEAAERGQAALVAVPRAREVRGLHDLHKLPGTEDEWEAATRLGAPSLRLLCAYVQQNGRATLDLAGTELLPDPPKEQQGDTSIPVAAVRAVMRRTIPVSADWFRSAEANGLVSPPGSWEGHPMLGDVRVLYQPVRNGQAQTVDIGGMILRLDVDLGLVRA
ncbi:MULTISPECIES: CRISPR-associated helicase Cas3' [Streptomyces]|uniref:CRISPR-associated helicase Cas3 n=1 Tax=Streptomyces tsukubensis (strain DSM 42081 / NBRC 108919 / NRRL 18488 / 9993) TaxID=1114943 RepID=I2N803_STRT9|nr:MULTISPECIES: CRISPR-associated helicase Cas3' [Streptomyces]AZK97016.1 CRISPR-associated helicase Cas3' [Streptomyces tsukubensis]EIF93150.1 CRISPR-associated helicase Cas3 [Streptomyces tsukubensis NRRL18488]MYS66547.1 CRISPR-associated helicase Cas3' [Streptomyces sp. SID5473]QKM67005.1 CRISPR-associated helicase Cas3' [Streptomyces tsukubensis NRRL18488]TAI41516.1 CRISPR-associated helicase Cas3' [Streptomyces tsukubensis]